MSKRKRSRGWRKPQKIWAKNKHHIAKRDAAAGSVHHLPSFASSRAASTPGIDHEAVLHTCVSRVLCGTVPARWHVFVCQYFIKAVALHASPHSSWTRSTTVRPVAAHIEPTDSASGRMGPTKTTVIFVHVCPGGGGWTVECGCGVCAACPAGRPREL